jgi:ABC-type sugar transport system ATPase subunit
MDLDLSHEESHALPDGNGAGKSTFARKIDDFNF